MDMNTDTNIVMNTCNDKNKKIVILDLDETIINSVEKENFNFNKYNNKLANFQGKYKDMDGYYLVFERPNLQSFLDYLFDNFTVAVWTAATKDYAIFIVKNIILAKKNRKLDHLFFKYHCDYSKHVKNGGMKDLDVLWDHYNLPGYSKENVIIIDDYDKVFKTNVTNKKSNPNNCYKIKPFMFKKKNSEDCDELSNVQAFLEEWKNK